MSAKKFKVRGIEVSLWEKSFRVEGMHTVFFPPHITEETVTELIEAVYAAVEEQAIRIGNRKVVENISAKVETLLGK